jgi:hypothetical protein
MIKKSIKMIISIKICPYTVQNQLLTNDKKGPGAGAFSSISFIPGGPIPVQPLHSFIALFGLQLMTW